MAYPCRHLSHRTSCLIRGTAVTACAFTTGARLEVCVHSNSGYVPLCQPGSTTAESGCKETCNVHYCSTHIMCAHRQQDLHDMQVQWPSHRCTCQRSSGSSRACRYIPAAAPVNCSQATLQSACAFSCVRIACMVLFTVDMFLTLLMLVCLAD